MQFLEDAPAYLTVEVQGGQNVWYADWSVSNDNFQYNKSQVEAWVSQALNDPRSFPIVGIEPRHVITGNVIFRVVQDIGIGNAIGVANWNEFPVIVDLEAAWYGDMSLVIHEAIHAFFLAHHSPQNSISVMEPMEDSPNPMVNDEFLTAMDRAQIRQWKGELAAPDPEPPEPQKFYFPANLGSYMTEWHIPAGAKARVTATVRDPAPGVIRAVCADSHAAMLAEDRRLLCRSVGTHEQGFHPSGWTDAKDSGSLYVALIVELEAGVSPDQLNISHAEVQLSGTGDATAPSIAN